MGDSLLFPIEPLSANPTTHPSQRVSNTGSDSGVNSPHVLSPAAPVTLDNSQPYLTASTSRIKLPRGLLTPNQQLIHNGCKIKNMEIKYNCSKPNHPEPQSVLRTPTRQSYEH